jgi:AraC-like DNA-binding protein
MFALWLSHFFKDNMHMTLIEYENGKKLETSKGQIQSTDTSMAALAEKLGYQKSIQLIRSFKRKSA